MQFKTVHQEALPTSQAAQGPTFPWYDVLRSLNPTSMGTMPALELGAVWEVPSGVPAQGNKFQFMYLDLATSEGQPITYSAGTLLTYSTPGLDTVASTLTADGVHYGVTLTTGGLTPNAEVGNFIFFSDTGATAPIKANAAGNIVVSLKTSLVGNNKYDSDALAVVPVNGSAVSIIRPYHVTLCGAAGIPTGILLNDSVTGSKIVMQVKGLAQVISSNSGAALVAGTPAIAAAAGVLTGGSATGRARIVPLIAYNSGTIFPIFCDVDLD